MFFFTEVLMWTLIVKFHYWSPSIWLFKSYNFKTSFSIFSFHSMSWIHNFILRNLSNKSIIFAVQKPRKLTSVHWVQFMNTVTQFLPSQSRIRSTNASDFIYYLLIGTTGFVTHNYSRDALRHAAATRAYSCCHLSHMLQRLSCLLSHKNHPPQKCTRDLFTKTFEFIVTPCIRCTVWLCMPMNVPLCWLTCFLFWRVA